METRCRIPIWLTFGRIQWHVMLCSVPQGSVLGPRLFIAYTADLADKAAEHGVNFHSFADDTQLYLHCRRGDMAMRTHVTAVVRACFAALRQIRSMRRSLSRQALLTLVRALIVSKVDYCNSVLAGIPGQLQDRLQSVLNSAARLVFSARRSEHITPLLRELHWLRVPKQVTFRLSVLAYRCLHGTAPA